MALHPNDPISPSSFFYQLGYSGSCELISIVLHPESGCDLTCLQLQQTLLGVQIVMTGRGTASHLLALEIIVTILGLGRVANGLLRYFDKAETITSYAADKRRFGGIVNIVERRATIHATIKTADSANDAITLQQANTTVSTPTTLDLTTDLPTSNKRDPPTLHHLPST